MRVNLLCINNTFNNEKISFKQNKGVYLCSTLATGFKATKEFPTIKSYIEFNMQKALTYADKITKKGDYPYWNHSTWPKFIDDTKPQSRKFALSGCIDLVKRCDLLVYFGRPKGGMKLEIKEAKEAGIPVLSSSKYLKLSKTKIDELIENSTHYKNMKKVTGD